MDKMDKIRFLKTPRSSEAPHTVRPGGTLPDRRRHCRQTVKPTINGPWFVGLAGLALSTTILTGCFPNEQNRAEEPVSGQEIQQVTPAGSSTWDVNDISVLYPLKSHGSDAAGRLVRLTEGPGLMSQDQFSSILTLFRRDFKLDFSSGGQARQMNQLDMWGVTAFRIHSCMQKKATDPCTPTVNIIAQPIIGNESSTAEFAMHLVYLPSVSSADLLKDMIRIRDKHAGSNVTIGKPLGVHPALSRPGGLGSPFAKALRDEFLLKHLRHDKLLGIAVVYVEPNRLQPWVFFNTNAKDMGRALDNSVFVFDPATSPNDCGVQLPGARQICRRDLATGRIVNSEERDASSDANAGKTPAGKPFMDNFLSLALKDTTNSFDLIGRDLARWEDVLTHIENPRKIGADETNCASCHRPHTDRIRFRKVFTLRPDAGPNAFRPAGTTGCTPGTSVDNMNRGVKTFNIRNFGYLHNEPIVSQRVQNETMLVCEQLKQLVR